MKCNYKMDADPQINGEATMVASILTKIVQAGTHLASIGHAPKQREAVGILLLSSNEIRWHRDWRLKNVMKPEK